ncbi:DUF2812 domain-containing protein [Staphylococcus condimenti]|uniref:DUF2812 domain-containing protein n=1 Tax=Staphylococcus condimenti TaxID=70255 RepID=A0A4Q7CJS0_9STAP|nr:MULTISPECIES: DUF2812 domain-containing protein [Staphylococcus]APR61812.1 hypothetical protein BTZ13_11515 [Staphylococcus condimenti]MDK8645652.1 DUF2812 domain-containing protein [Staphylococcus condimenti]OFO99412.1 hypothetical protein HMPREF3007_05940 [Staphylococcus sp. HMSC065E08]RZH99715.1 DUF2812 domain-containing protein [Staphylococcus condimenti]RZI01131.1 DUF2812 domain-containing protein [Staphylococcus condimenti]
MKKQLKLYFKGSPSEIRYLETQQKDGYMLTNIKNGIYTFEENSAVSDTKLQVTFVRSEDLKEPNTKIEKSPFLSVLAKQLNYSKYTVLYSYLKEKDNPIYNLADTKAAEHEYLSFFKRIIFILAVLTMFVCVAFWSYFTAIGKPSSKLLIPMQIMISVFIILSPFNILINRRIRKSCPKIEDELYLSYSVSVKSPGSKPDIDSLKYLGAWRYQTDKEGKYYYNLLSKEPKEVILHNVRTKLHLPEEDVYVYSQFDLFPIVMHF